MKKINQLDVCKECGGNCCRYYIHRHDVSESTAKWMEYLRARFDKVFESHGVIYSIQEMRCKHWTPDGCDMGEKRPIFCHEFPQMWDEDWAEFCPLMNIIYKSKGL